MSQTGTGRVINDGHYHIHNVADKNLVLDITSTRNVVAMPMVNTNLGWSVKWSTNHYSITRIGETAVSYLQMDNNSKNINLGAPNATGNTQDWDVGVHRHKHFLNIRSTSTVLSMNFTGIESNVAGAPREAELKSQQWVIKAIPAGQV